MRLLEDFLLPVLLANYLPQCVARVSLADARASMDSNDLIQSIPAEPITTRAGDGNDSSKVLRSLTEGGQLTLPQYLAESGLEEDQYLISNTVEHGDIGMRTHHVDLVYNGQRVYNSRMVITTDSSGNVVSGDRLNTMKTWKPQSGMCGVPSRSAETEPDLDQVERALTNFFTPEESKIKQENMGLRDSTTASWGADTVQFIGYVYFAINAYTIIEGMQWLSTVRDSVLDIITDRRGSNVLQMNNWAQSFRPAENYTYQVYGREEGMSPETSRPQLMKSPGDTIASPYGWHGTRDPANYNMPVPTTIGNNIIVKYAGAGNTQIMPQPSNPSGGFSYPVDLAKDPLQYQEAVGVHVFYWANYFHDLMFRYGFDVNAGNFQQDDPNGGKGTGDPIVVNIQRTDKMNNANFVTYPNGKISELNLYLWDKTTPRRDGGLCVDIVIHELTHGVTSRLVGGPDITGCLSTPISSGVAEGWSDIVALFFKIGTRNNRNQEYGIGAWASSSKTVRKYTYTSDQNINPLKFGDLAKTENQKAHTIGLIWATILYEVMWNLNDKLGISDDIFTPNKNFGNTLFLQALIGGWKLQSCKPTIIDARDQFLQALQSLRPEMYCVAWEGFAKRGMGVEANNNYASGNSLPSGCRTR
ncbi:hypothetical protein IWQ61_004727 [Dispira simplex]|nr:hypothetical protein IWQ61_004727 [Dispira simplex]